MMYQYHSFSLDKSIGLKDNGCRVICSDVDELPFSISSSSVSSPKLKEELNKQSAAAQQCAG